MNLEIFTSVLEGEFDYQIKVQILQVYLLNSVKNTNQMILKNLALQN